MKKKEKMQIKKSAPKRLISIANGLLLLMIFFLSCGLTALLFSRETFNEISASIYSGAEPLMNSTILDVLLHKEYVIAIFILFILILLKEFKVKSLLRRFQINLVVFLTASIYSSLLIYLLYRPML